MKKLNVSQMENLQGGDKGCALAVAGLALTVAGAFVTTTPIGGAIFLGSMVISGIGMGACN